MNKLYPNHRRTWRRTVTRLSLNGLVSLSAVTGLFIVPSCSTTEREGGGETNLRITLAPSITTRVTGTAFDEEDAIGLSVVPWSDGCEQPLSSSRWEDNVKFVYRDGQFVSSATAYFPDATTANTFYAYYPYNQTGFRSNTSSLAVAVATDQSDAASRTASDWMVAVTRNVKPDGQAVPVAFRHILSLMQIRMTAGDGVTADELLEAEVLLKDFCSTALYDVDAETFGEPADVTDIRPYGTTRIEGDYVTGLSAVVVPQTREAGETVIYFTFKGKTMAYKPSSEFTFEPGKSHLFTATIGMTPQGPTLAVSAQIDDWQEGGVITGDASKPELPSVSDYDGNTYPVIEINGVKWLAANLRTTHYNDGTEIPVVDGGTDAWDALTAPAACITENNADYREKYGLLYNYYAVEKGDLCPKGWKVPSKEELGLLPFNDEKGAYSLMAPDENWSSGYNPTNTTGFSALPAGMSVGNGWMTGDAYFWSSTCDDTQTFPASYLYLAMYSGIDTHYKYAGMSIRCIEDEDVPEPEPEPEPTETVKDIDGNEYPVVKIGDFYWMASNLKTQHLNDGTPIPVIEGGCSAWDGQTEPAACIFMNKSENEEKYGLLYNFYTVATGKLCPEGWTVPDWEQTDALPYGSIAQNVALMAPDDNWTALASDPTNTTGFSALPGGNSSWAFWERGSAYFWTSYTSDSGPASFTLGGTTMISQSYYESAGLSVRCIKKAEPEPEPEPAATVKDIDGNEYPVVEIGGLTWMAANLKTLHLNDGTEIPIGKGQEASWDTFTTPTACDFMDKTENRATYGLLYNFYTVDTGKICPEGWTVPDWDQMQSLLDAVPKAADLMAPDSRWNHYNPTNASGFGALPGGIQSYYYWLTSDAGIWTSYKGDDSPGYLYLSNMPYIAQSYLYSGMYVRCIKSTNTSDL